jgi:hypothetical protein
VCEKAVTFAHMPLLPLTSFVLDPAQDFYAFRYSALLPLSQSGSKCIVGTRKLTDLEDEIAREFEEELRAVLDRLRGDLEGRVEQQAAGVASKGKGKGSEPES